MDQRELKKKKTAPLPKNVLVTGNSGLIGSCLWKKLRDNHNFVASSFSLPSDNIVSLDEVMYAAQGMKCIVHLSAESDAIRSVMDPWGNFRTNVIGTMNVLRAAREHRAERIVFASDIEAKNPTSPYAASKLASEGYLRSFHHSYGMGSVILRFVNVYGRYGMNHTGLISGMIKSAIVENEVILNGDGTEFVDFLHSGDASNAIIKSLEVDIARVSGKTIPIGTGTLVSMDHVVEMLMEIHGRKLNVVKTIRNAAAIREQEVIDTSIARDLISFDAETSLEDGLLDTYEWMKVELKKLKAFHKM